MKPSAVSDPLTAHDRPPLSLSKDFHFDGVVRSHGWYDLPPFEYARAPGILRTFAAVQGRAAPIAFRARDGRLYAQADALDRRNRSRRSRPYRRLYPGPVRSTDHSIARRYHRFGIFRGLALWLDMTRDWHEAQETL